MKLFVNVNTITIVTSCIETNICCASKQPCGQAFLVQVGNLLYKLGITMGMVSEETVAWEPQNNVL